MTDSDLLLAIPLKRDFFRRFTGFFGALLGFFDDKFIFSDLSKKHREG